MFDYFYAVFQRHPAKQRKRVHLINDIMIRPFNPDEPVTFSNCQFIICVGCDIGADQEAISWKKCILPPYTELF